MTLNVRTGIMGAGILLGLFMSLMLWVVAASAQAQTGSCEDQFTKLKADTQSVPITGGKVEKERAGLLKLVDDAESLASIGKTSDAVTKLDNFTVKVDQLEAAGRISTESASLLRSDAQATITCLQGSATA